MLQTLKTFALFGGEWVLYLLLFLSLWCLAVIWDRFLYFRKRSADAQKLQDQAPPLIQSGKWRDLEKLLKNSPSVEGAVLREGLAHWGLGREALERVLESAKIRERLALEKNLLVLGTLGVNAPFIGLFGTVLGIIKAFNDLALSGTSGPTVVMRGVSEALVATAVGLLIAIPAVVFFNAFQGRVKRTLLGAERLSKLLLAKAPSGKK